MTKYASSISDWQNCLSNYRTSRTGSSILTSLLSARLSQTASSLTRKALRCKTCEIATPFCVSSRRLKALGLTGGSKTSRSQMSPRTTSVTPKRLTTLLNKERELLTTFWETLHQADEVLRKLEM